MTGATMASKTPVEKASRLRARQRLRGLIAGWLETRTGWGKFFARPAQIKAAAKKMEQANRIPKPVADLIMKEFARV